ncbi:MAG: glycosyltransferase family 4 protein [Acidobacteriota bacterium]|nr:glycosyltransferase family 4 protein [Acidobacteriota bacterium]
MRVLIIANVAGKAEAGGAGVIYNIAKELCRFGHTVKVMFAEDLLPAPRWPARFRTVEFARRAARYISESKSEFDIANIYAPCGFSYGSLRRKRGVNAGPPYVLTMHGLEERRNYAMGREAKRGRADYFRWRNLCWQRFYHMRTYRWSIEAADHCIVTNRESLLFLQMQYGLAPDRVWFVPNGVGQEFFHQRNFSGAYEPKLLFVGTWIDHKGIYNLAEAFAQLLGKHPGTRLTIAGCAEPEEKIRRSFSAAVQCALEVRRFVPRTEMPALYAEHDIFVLPSLVEGMPLVLLEAMASGLAVVTTESSGMTDLVEDGYDGLLTIPGDTPSLLAALNKVSRDPQLRERLGSAAQEKMKRYTWSRSARGHEAVLLRALGIQPVSSVLQEEARSPERLTDSSKVLP